MFGFGNLPEITKNLIIINGVMLLALTVYPDLYGYVSLYYFSNDMFRPWQIVTHMFSHAQIGSMHLFFNMFTLFMFGSVLERVLGPKRFLTLYMLTGFGGAFLHQLVDIIQVYQISGHVWLTPDLIDHLAIPYSDKLELAKIYATPMVGASGAVFGLLTAFAMLFPNAELMLLFPPIPVRAKILISILIISELIFGYMQMGNIAHFAHLGGALFGYLILKSWKRRRIL